MIDDDIGDVCERCDASPPDPREAARWLDAGMPEATALALAACERCLTADGRTSIARTPDLRDNQDTLLDDAHFASTHHGLALDLHRFWLERAVPRAWQASGG